METVLIVIHLMVVLALVGVVLLQRSEGGGLGIGGVGRGPVVGRVEMVRLLAGHPRRDLIPADVDADDVHAERELTSAPEGQDTLVGVGVGELFELYSRNFLMPQFWALLIVLFGFAFTSPPLEVVREQSRVFFDHFGKSAARARSETMAATAVPSRQT